jgi:hypothetical protein
VPVRPFLQLSIQIQQIVLCCLPVVCTLYLSLIVQPVIQEPVPASTTSEAGTAAAAALGSATAQALWLESHLADVINALWRLLSHDLDRVLRGAADGALRQLRDVERSDDEKTAVTVQQAASVLGIMGKVFKVRWLHHCDVSALKGLVINVRLSMLCVVVGCTALARLNSVL